MSDPVRKILETMWPLLKPDDIEHPFGDPMMTTLLLIAAGHDEILKETGSGNEIPDADPEA